MREVLPVETKEEEKVKLKTRVVNKYKETWDVYIGRGSPFGNPYKIGPDGTRKEVIRKYRYYFLIRVLKEKDFRNSVLELKGKRLGCFCKPKACHGDIIVNWLEK